MAWSVSGVLLLAHGFGYGSALAAPAPLSLPGDRTATGAVKAAFVLNFARYTEWPSSSFVNADSPIEVRVLGDENVASALETLAGRAAPIAGRRLLVRSVRPERTGSQAWRRLVDDLRRSHLVFLGSEFPEKSLEPLLGELSGADLLTVGDLDGFAASGGMLGLVAEGERFLFDANAAAIAASKISVSARVLKLARRIDGEASP